MSTKQTLTFPRKLNDADAGFYFLGEQPHCNVAMVMLAVLAEEIPFEEMLTELWSAAEYVPRFLDRLQPAPFGIAAPSWTPADQFEAREQVREVRLAPGSNWEDALSVVDKLQETDFPGHRPPWEILLINGCPAGRALFVMKVHHALSDGTALSLLFAKAFGKAFLEQSGLEVEAVSEAPTSQTALRWALRDRGSATVDFARRTRRRLPGLLHRPTRRREWESVRQLARPRYRQHPSEFGTRRRLSGFRIAASDWNDEAAARNGSANDLYLAIVANAMRRRFPQWSLDIFPLQMVMPVDLREESATQDGGNVTGVSVVELDGDPRHLRDLHTVRQRTGEAKANARTMEPTLFDEVVQQLPGRLRGGVQYREFATRDVVATNVPVPIQGELCGVPLEMMFMVAPSIGTAVSFSLTSYGENLYLAANADVAVVPGGLDKELSATLRDVFGEAAALRDGSLIPASTVDGS
ncbi:MAG: diacylglycerol O-acyltransferase / wax synthase [Solirubrobacterales bacterium]|jgi:WS/DGAT/MGAT family acyltransferase|nr:diacylglycerol O-acyltransferase / wax synthase [Solirubrobacterales bacterium]